MINVYILEDSQSQLIQLKKDVQEILTELKIQSTIKTFSTIEKLQSATADTPTGHKNVYLLDLEINGVKDAGLEISQQIRQHDQKAELIFITIHEELMYQTYKYRVSALDFIAKDGGQVYTDLYKDFQHIKDHLGQQTVKPFVYKDYSNQMKIDFYNVNFIESNYNNSHSSILNTVDNQQIQINQNLKEIGRSEGRLFRSHRSFLVNPQQIRSIAVPTKTIHFYNGQSCPVSRLHLQKLLKLIATRN